MGRGLFVLVFARGLLGGNQSANKHRMVPPFYIQMKNIVAILFIIFGFVKAWSANGDIFTVTTIEGIEMNFKVINESAKTCEVTKPAIPLETEGVITIIAVR